MLNYTKALFNKTVSDLKLFEKIWTVSTLSVYVIYLIYALVSGSGFLAANIVLITLSALYFAYYSIITFGDVIKLKSHKKLARKIYRYSKYIINSVTLFTLLYSIWVSPFNVHPFKILAAVFMALMLMIQLVLELSITIVERRVNMLLEALNADIEFITKPVNSVKNAFKRMVGQEPEPEKERSENRIYLDELVEKNRKAKSAEKAAARAERNEKISTWLKTHVPKRRKANADTDEQNEKELAVISANIDDKDS